MISYQDYTEYDTLERLGLDFIGKPSKNNLTNIYTLPLKNPINLAIPQSKILEIYQNNQNTYMFQYVIDDFALLQFLNNVDAKIINTAQKKSPEWFNKELSHRQLLKLYDSILYEEEVYKLLDISINAQNIEEVLEDMSEYNEDEIDNITISLVGIEFYRKTFKLCVELTAIEYTSGDDYSYGGEDDNVNDGLVVRDDNVGQRVNNEETLSHNSNHDESDLDLESLMSGHNDEEEEEKDDTEDLDSRDLESDTETRLENEYDVSSNLSIDRADKNEILELIQRKEEEKNKYKINSVRAKEASASLDDMASNLDAEILKYKSQLKKYT